MKPKPEIRLFNQPPCPHCGATERIDDPPFTVDCDAGFGIATFTDRGGGEVCAECDHPFDKPKD